jgi:hypothetical protein
MAKPKGCPRCGSESGYRERVRVSGYEEYAGAWGYEPAFASNDHVRYRTPAFVICEDCGCRIRRAVAVPLSEEKPRG